MTSEDKSNVDNGLLEEKLKADAYKIDDTVSAVARQKLSAAIKAESASNVVSLDVKRKQRFLLPLGLAASVMGVILFNSLQTNELPGNVSDIAQTVKTGSDENTVNNPVSSDKQSIVSSTKTNARFASKQLRKEYDAIKADLDKLKQQIAAL